MARPPNADGKRTRQAILDAALALFAEKGYFGTSLRDVARAVGVRESALYNYFPGKESLFEALLAAESAEKVEHLGAILDEPVSDAHETLERLATFMLDRFVMPRQQQLFRILMADGMRLARDGRINLIERMGSGLPRFEAIMQRLMAEGWLRDGDPELFVMQFIGPLLFWRQRHAVGIRSAAIRHRHAFARAHVEQFLNGTAVRRSVVSSRARRARVA
jgi:AcrR family transcriptional regulator